MMKLKTTNQEAASFYPTIPKYQQDFLFLWEANFFFFKKNSVSLHLFIFLCICVWRAKENWR